MGSFRARVRARVGRYGLGALLLPLALLLPASPAGAANGPTFRDCSLFTPGFDPDFVQLSGVTVGPQGTLLAPAGQRHLGLEASESPDPGDQSNHVTSSATVSAPNAQSQTVSGSGTGKVNLSVPLLANAATDTIMWSATFDNGNHPCPGANDPVNTMSNPFVVTVTQSCLVPNLRGMRLKAARRSLTMSDCRLGSVRGRRKGRVRRQMPGAGAVLPPGSTVNVRLR